MDYLLEIGTEELPAGTTGEIAQNFQKLFLNKIAEYQLSGFDCELYSTPRRIAIIFKNLPAQTKAREELIKGPSQSAPEQALAGFAKKNNKQITDIQKIDGHYCLTKETPPIELKEILKESLNFAINSLKGERWMSWGLGHFNFSRPVRWLVSILDENIFPLEILGLKANNETRINRLLEAGHQGFKYIKIPKVGEYISILQNNLVEPSPQKRRETILSQIAELEKQNNFKVQVPEELLKEVIDLLEFPKALIGSFEEKFLNLPDFLTITVLTHHQRYFPCFSPEGKLLNKFIFIANCLPSAHQTVIEGNERVLRARLKDAEFFVQEDLKTPLKERIQKLGQMTFQKELKKDSSIKGKTERLKLIVGKFPLSKGLEDLKQSAELAKCDLASAIVFEFPELQGLVGGFIAKKQKYNSIISQAITEQYKPLATGKELPQSEIGALLSIADKADNIISLLSIGKMPTGSADPFALRRQTQGIYEILATFPQIQLSIKDIAQSAYNALSQTNETNQEFEQFFESISTFLKQRLIFILSQNYNADLVLAFTNTNQVLSMRLEELIQIIVNFESLSKTNKNNLLESLISIRRIYRILKNKNPQINNLDFAFLELDEEKVLYSQKIQNWSDIINLKEYINNFFDKVLVDDKENPQASLCRQALLMNILNKANELFLEPDWDKLINYLENTNT